MTSKRSSEVERSQAVQPRSSQQPNLALKLVPKRLVCTTLHARAVHLLGIAASTRYRCLVPADSFVEWHKIRKEEISSIRSACRMTALRIRKSLRRVVTTQNDRVVTELHHQHR